MKPPTTSCQICGGDLLPGDRFCASCGGVTQQKSCAACDFELQPSDQFCPNCGTPSAGSSPNAKASSALLGGQQAWSRVLERLRAATLGEFVIDREIGRGGMA